MDRSMDTEQDAIAVLRAEGYTHEFFIRDDGVHCHACASEVVAPEALTVDRTFRFEGASNPDDESIVVAVSEGPCGLKGILVSPFGPSMDGPRADVLRRLGT